MITHLQGTEGAQSHGAASTAALHGEGGLSPAAHAAHQRIHGARPSHSVLLCGPGQTQPGGGVAKKGGGTGEEGERGDGEQAGRKGG